MSRSTARRRTIPRSQHAERARARPDTPREQRPGRGRDRRARAGLPRSPLRAAARASVKPGESRRRPQRLESHRADDAAQHDAALRLAEHSATLATSPASARTACRTCRPCPASSAPPVPRARARLDRRRRGSGRSARDHGRAQRRTGRAEARPCRRAPARRRARAPSIHRSRGFPGDLLTRTAASPQRAASAAAARTAGPPARPSRSRRPTSACGRAARPRCRASCPRTRRRDRQPWRRVARP